MIIELSNATMTLAIDRHTGALRVLRHPGDPHAMNWVCESGENPWFLDGHGWGLGFLAVPGGNGPQRWQHPTTLEQDGETLRVRYQVSDVEVLVTRQLCGDQVEESYEFFNRDAAEQPIWGIGLYVPFNDNYPDATTCITRRCNAHLWCGGNVAYACCLRMGGDAPHLGLVLREGYLGGYSIENRGYLLGGSNIRGAIVFNAQGVVLPPGGSHRIAWTLFWHTGWDDFFAQAREIPGFVEVGATSYTVIGDEPVQVTVSDPQATVAESEGDVLKVRYGQQRETWLRVQRVDDPAQLVRRRVAFIYEKQQVRDQDCPYDGAFVCYDNALQAQHCDPAWGDHSEGHERVGMGVLLALALQQWPDAEVEKAVRRYHRFVRTQLQDADGAVYGTVQQTGQRLYDYPWAAHLHLELYKALGDARFLTDCFQTLRAYYDRDGDAFYALGIPMLDAVQTFTAAGRPEDATELQSHFLRHGDRVIAAGLHVPPHEVRYEQTIIGPATIIALECYLLTGEVRYLDGACRLLPALEAFSGRQPDHHLHEIAIRHWDGYWFGARRMWGDTFPHHWSAATGWAYYRYWQATGDERYRQRGRAVLLNNLSAFSADGSASCAYIYPDAVNGNAGRFWEALANDQDWALVFLLQAAALDPSLLGSGS